MTLEFKYCYITTINEFNKYLGKPPYGLCIEICGSWFMLHVGFGGGLYLKIGRWEFTKFAI